MSWRDLLSRIGRATAEHELAPVPVDKTPPIAIISFNRPQYLKQLLDSLLSQTPRLDRPLLLFQDNVISPFTGERMAKDQEVEACLKLFRDRVPDGEVILAAENLGPARNFLRAEERVFNELRAEVAYFFMDDIVLSPHYISMMDLLHHYAAKQNRIGFFSVSGTLTRPLEEQKQRPNAVIPLAHSWGYGVTRPHWTALREWLAPYHQLSEGRDYLNRPTEDIARTYWRQGVPLVSTDHAIVRQLGTCALQRTSINTFAVFARYIGEEGLNFNRERYEKRGFSKTEMYPDPVMLEFPNAETLSQYHAEQWKVWQQRFQRRMTRNRKWRETYEATMGPLSLEYQA